MEESANGRARQPGPDATAAGGSEPGQAGNGADSGPAGANGPGWAGNGTSRGVGASGPGGAVSGTGRGWASGSGNGASQDRLAGGRLRGTHYKWLALSNTTLGMLAATVNASIVIISLPAIFRGIQLNPLTPGNFSYLLWMLMGYLVVSAVLVVTLGRLGDIYGRVRMYNAGFAIFALGALALPFDPLTGPAGALWLIGFRVIQAVGGAMLMANAPAILTDAFPSDQRGMAMGVNQVAGISGMFIGLVLGGVLAAIDWRLVFIVSVPIGIGGAIWSYLSLREIGIRTPARIDWLGNVTFAFGLIALLIGITYGLMPYGGHSMGWTSPLVLTGILGGIALLAAFCLIELRVRSPMFDLRLMRIRAFAAGITATLLASIARGGLQFMLIIWLQGIWLPLHGYGYSQTPLWAGIYLVPLTIGFLVSAPLSGILSDRFGAKLFTVGGPLLAAATFLALAFLPVNFAYWQFAVLIAINGFGTGLFVSPNRAEMMNAVPASERGAAGGMIATFMNSASVLSIGIFFSLMVAGLSSALPASLFSGLTAQGVPAHSAAPISHLPPIGVLFAAFLGYNPMQQLLGHLLTHLSPAHAAYVIGREFFPHLITGPFHDGIGVAFGFAIMTCVIAAIASALTGRIPSPRAAHESVGSELAAVAAESSGIEPSELVAPNMVTDSRDQHHAD